MRLLKIEEYPSSELAHIECLGHFVAWEPGQFDGQIENEPTEEYSIPFELMTVCFFTIYLWVLMYGLLVTTILLVLAIITSLLIVRFETQIGNAVSKFIQRINLAFIGLITNFA